MKNKVKKLFAILTMCIMLSSVIGVTDESISLVCEEAIEEGNDAD